MTFLSTLSIQGLHNAKCEMRKRSIASDQLTEGGHGADKLLVQLVEVNRLLNVLPKILARQISKEKLERPHVIALERQRFEEIAEFAGNIDRFLDNFNIDGTHGEHFLFQIINKLSVPVSEALNTGDRYVISNELPHSVRLRMAIAFVTFELWGYNTFTGLYRDIDILNKMNLMNTAFNLQTEKSILPVKVFSDYVDIVDSIDLLATIGNIKVGARWSDPFYRPLLGDVDNDRVWLEAHLNRYVDKYPCLEDQCLKDFGKHLLNFYTLSPRQMIDRIGRNIVCFPYQVPLKLVLSDREHLSNWEEVGYWRDGQPINIMY